MVAAAGSVLHQLTAGPGGEGATPAGTDLAPWDLLGCWSVRVEPWFVAAGEDGAGEERFAPPATGELPASFAPPDTLMLLPDSIDRWGRALRSYRAAPRPDTGRAGRHLRWVASGDTLWLLWSESGTRAGLALRRSGDSLVGNARALSGADSVDASARASAVRVNCSTGRRERPRAWRRR